ncbi:MAG: hypothetical protein ACM3NJ_00655 [Methanobacterium sp.]
MKAFNYYGRYTSLPQTIEMLLDFEKEFSKDRYNLDSILGFILKEDMRYMSTPLDVIPFANPGADGIHYGFLTDFGRVSNLEQAFIVCVSPMDFDDEVWLVAKNIKDFLGLVYADDAILYNNFSDINSYLRYIQTKEVDEYADEFNRQTSYIKERFKERFAIEPIDDMAQYLSDLMEERKKVIAVPTLNSLGVVQISSAKEHEKFLFDGEKIDLKTVQQFFKIASLESKLAFIRDAQTKYYFEDAKLRQFIIKELQALGLADEAKRLKISFRS